MVLLRMMLCLALRWLILLRRREVNATRRGDLGPALLRGRALLTDGMVGPRGALRCIISLLPLGFRYETTLAAIWKSILMPT